MHHFLAADGSESLLLEELRRSLPGSHVPDGPGMIRSEFPWDPALPPTALVFLRQWLPNSQSLQAESIRLWAGHLLDAAVVQLPESKPWRLHIASQYAVRGPVASGARAHFTQSRFRNERDGGAAAAQQKAVDAGQHRCTLIEEAFLALLQQKRRHLLRLRGSGSEPFRPEESLLQLILTSPTHGVLAAAPAPLPSSHALWLSPFLKGEIPIAVDKAAPSRAFAKLVESETRLGRQILPGETCVDLGAAPGSWTYVAVQRGARVIAVDRAPLRDDLRTHPNVTSFQGDAFAFEPRRPVDWMLCDVIAAPERSIQLVLDWTRRRWCRQFVVTIKFSGVADLATMQAFKASLQQTAPGFHFVRLCANKNEACVFGSVPLKDSASPVTRLPQAPSAPGSIPDGRSAADPS